MRVRRTKLVGTQTDRQTENVGEKQLERLGKGDMDGDSWWVRRQGRKRDEGGEGKK